MIPINDFFFDGNEKKYLEECIVSGWVSSEGPFVKKFEESFASFIGVKNGIAVCSGTAALETALFALGVGVGDEVIMPSFTIISCAIACIRLGAKPVLVDIEPDAWTMDVSQIKAKITKRTKVIMPVHIYGHPVNMDEIILLSKRYGLKVLEDIAEAQGAQYYSEYAGRKWLNCGAMGDIAATSFYANKIVTTGEGGMVLTNNKEYAQRARLYRNLYFDKERKFHHIEIGYNFRMTNLQAAVGLAQTEQIKKSINTKKKLGRYYRDKLSEIKQIRFMVEKPYAKSVYWVYAIELRPECRIDAEKLIKRLKRHNIGSRHFFKGLHHQPALNKLKLFRKERYPRTDYAYKYGLYLPSGLALSERQIEKVVEVLKLELGKR